MCKCGHNHKRTKELVINEAYFSDTKTPLQTLLKQRDALRVLLATGYGALGYVSPGTDLNDLISSINHQIDSAVESLR